MPARPVDLRSLIREIPDFPKPGIGFKDITPLLADAGRAGARPCGSWPRRAPAADRLRGGGRGARLPARARRSRSSWALASLLARKPGKLPYETVSAEYLLEYGAGQLELHTDAVAAGKRVLVHDDLLATGGTAAALCELVEQLGGRGGRLRLPDRAGLPRRPRAPGPARGPRPAGLRVLSLRRVPTARRSRTIAAPARSCGRSCAIRTTCRAGGRG